MPPFHPKISAVIKDLATYSETARKAKKDVSKQIRIKDAAYNALEMDRIRLMQGMPDAALESPFERHFERVKKAEDTLRQAEGDLRVAVLNRRRVTERLRDVMVAEKEEEEEVVSEAETEL